MTSKEMDALCRLIGRVERLEKAVQALVDDQPSKALGALGGKRKIHYVGVGKIPAIGTLCGERGEVFTYNPAHVNCEKCRDRLA